MSKNPALVLPLVIAILIRRRVSPATFRVGSRILLGIVTIAFAVGIANLMFNLPRQKGFVLIYSGLLLCGFNILMFALWYWEIDGGGPEQRRTSDRQAPDFLFPQLVGGLDENWVPQFFDYLYLAFIDGFLLACCRHCIRSFTLLGQQSLSHQLSMLYAWY